VGAILASMVSGRGAPHGRAPSSPRARLRLRGRPGFAAPGFVLLALAGAWLAHTLEYLRVWGTDGLAARLTAPLHLWMLPVGGVLLVVSSAGAARWVRLHRALSERLDRGRSRVTRSLRNLPAPADVPRRSGAVPAGTRMAGAEPASLSLAARLAALWASLTVTIGFLYLLQENTEAAAASLPLPGLAPISGLHAAAPLIVAAVAFALAACAVECRRRTSASARDVDAVERLLRALALLRRHAADRPLPAAIAHAAGPAHLGAQLWRRPPPVRAPAH
jgi:hypothetical protein